VTRRTLYALAAALLLTAPPHAAAAAAASYIEPPALAADVAAGRLPPVAERLPQEPAVAAFSRPGQTPGKYGGTLRMLMGQTRDVRMMVVYGYARLVKFDYRLDLVPDILQKVDVEDERVFTLHLRPGHRWSDGAPFTAEDFRYYW
jgi:peptide/nickel transport system substrate-binding protein